MSNEELYKEITTLKEEIIFFSNKNNRLSEQLIQTKIRFEGKNNQYKAKEQECERLKEYLSIAKSDLRDYEELQNWNKNKILELAKIIDNCCRLCKYKNGDCFRLNIECERGILQWLEQECEG